MFKKNSWIVALILALSLSVFFVGCIDVAIVEDTETYEEVALDKGFNIGGGQAYQKGWAVAGILWDEGTAAGAKDLGYQNDSFGGARYLVLNLEGHDGYSTPKGTVQIIWGAEVGNDKGDTYGRWNQQALSASMYEFTGATMKIDLTKALKDYANWIDPSITKRKIVIQYVEGINEIKSATLLIPNTPIEIPQPCDNPECRDFTCTLGKDKCPNFLGFDPLVAANNYQIPGADTDNYFFVNLNDHKTPDVAGIGVPTVTLRADKTAIKATFDTYRERLVFKFTAEQAARLAAAPAGLTVDIAATGTAVGEATPARNFQYFIGNATVSNNWNGTSSPAADTLDNFATGSALGLANAGDADNFTYLILRYETGSASAAPATDVEIESIKITIAGNISVTAIALDMAKPLSGWRAPTTVSNAQINGTVTWIPALPANGRFATNTAYYANIVVSPKPGFNLSSAMTAPTITLNEGTISGVNSYNAATRTITTGMFPTTAGKNVPNPEDGDLDATVIGSWEPTTGATKVWDSRDWIGDKSGTVSASDPFVNAGGGHTVSIGGKGINITGRGNDYSTWDLKLTGEGSVGLNMSTSIYKIYIYGIILEAGYTAEFAVQATTGWADFGRITGNGNQFQEFKIEKEIPAGFSGNIRLGSAGSGADHRIIMIYIEKTGEIPVCPCNGTNQTAGNHNCSLHCGAATPSFCDCVCAICNPPNVAGTYTVPTGGAGEYYLDLNGDVAGYFNTSATPGLTRKIENDKVTYYINKADQGAYIPLCAIPPKI